MEIDFTNSVISDGVGNALNLYNGNIRFMQTTLTDVPTGDALPMLNAYKYDQLNRLLETRSHETGLSSNAWSPSSYGDEYLNTFTRYRANPFACVYTFAVRKFPPLPRESFRVCLLHMQSENPEELFSLRPLKNN